MFKRFFLCLRRISVLFLSCSQPEEVKPRPSKQPLELPVEPPVPDSLVLIAVDFKRDLLPHSSTPILQFQSGKEAAGEYLYGATVNFHKLGGDVQNLDVLLYHDTTLVFRDTYIMRDTINHIMSISLARQITTPSFNHAKVRVTNTGDSTSYGIEIKRVSIEKLH